MHYKNDINELGLNRPNEDPHYNGFLDDTDYPPDEDFFVQLTNDLDLPMLEPDSVLLRDASPNEIISEATSDDFQMSPLIETNSMADDMKEFCSTDFVSDMFLKSELNEIDADGKTEHFIDFEQYFPIKESPTPSDSSVESFNTSDYNSASPLNDSTNSIFDSPPISPSEILSNSPEDVRSRSQPNTLTLTKPVILQSKIQKSVKRLKLDVDKCTETIKLANRSNILIKGTIKNILQNTNLSMEETKDNSGKISRAFQSSNPSQKKNTVILKKQNVINLNEKSTAVYTKPISNIIDIQNLTNVPNGKIPINNANRNFKSTSNILYPKQDNLSLNNVKVITVPSLNSGIIPMKNIDLKALKKQQRMIKNRESACMSRKRKKDYVCSLEQQLKDLTMENDKLKTENCALKKKISEFERITSQAFQLPAIITKNTKNTAFLLAFLLMVSINVGPFSSLLKTNNRNIDSIDNQIPMKRNTRNLLWVSEFPEDLMQNSTNGTKNKSELPICPMHVNQSESVRLASELRRWIGEPLYNWTNVDNKPSAPKQKTTKKLTEDKPLQYKFSSKVNSFYKLQNKRKVKKYSIKSDISEANEIQVYTFDPKYYEYAEFFESINKRDDTFYVVSFSGDHMLLPAINHNKTSRPKMSLIFPALTLNESTTTPNGHIKLMKIDCEVTNTNLVNVKQNSIPEHFRTPFNNITSNFNDSVDNMNASTDGFSDVNNVPHHNISFTKKERKAYKPYFMKDVTENGLILDKAKKFVRYP